MPLDTPTVLTTLNSASDLPSYSTPAVLPQSDRLVLVIVQNHKGSVNTLPTLSGCSMAWEQIATLPFSSNRLTVFGAIATEDATEGPITADYAGAVQTYCQMVVLELPDIATGPLVGNAIRQVGQATGTAVNSLSVPLGPFGSANNATIGFFGVGPTQDVAPGEGFSQVSDFGIGSSNRSLFVEWRSDPDTSVDASWATAGTAVKLGLALEIAPRPDLPIPAASINVPVRLSSAEVAIPHTIVVPVVVHQPVEQFRIFPAPISVRVWVHPAFVEPSGPVVPGIAAGSIPVSVTVHPAAVVFEPRHGKWKPPKPPRPRGKGASARGAGETTVTRPSSSTSVSAR